MGHPAMTQFVKSGSPPLLPRVDRLALLNIEHQPSEDSLPALTMIGGRFGSAGESFMTQFHERSGALLLRSSGMQGVNILRLEIPVDDGLERPHVAGDPGVDQPARRIDFEIFAVDAKTGAIGAQTDA